MVQFADGLENWVKKADQDKMFPQRDTAHNIVNAARALKLGFENISTNIQFLASQWDRLLPSARQVFADKQALTSQPHEDTSVKTAQVDGEVDD